MGRKISTVIVGLYTSIVILGCIPYCEARRVQDLDFIIKILTSPELSEEEINQRITQHLWRSWDEILPNLKYVVDNFGELYKSKPDALLAFFASVLTDIRAMVAPSLFSDLDTAYRNLNKLPQFWEIENKLAQIIMDLDTHSDKRTYFMRYLVVSLFRLLPGRINVERFKALYQESQARGRVEIIYTDSRDWSAARHGVTEISQIVTEAELEKTIKALKENGFVIGNIKRISPIQPERMSSEFRDLPTDEINKELTLMLNMLQRPFRLTGEEIDLVYEWWKHQVGEDVFSPFEKEIELKGNKLYTYLWERDLNKLRKLTVMRESLAKIIFSDTFSPEVKIATIIFDKYLSSMIKNVAMNLVSWYQSKYIEPQSELSGRHAFLTETKPTEQDYINIIEVTNLLLESLVLDRYVPHRLWLDKMYIQINPYDEDDKLDKDKLYREIRYLEGVIDEVVKSMHGEIFASGAERVVPCCKELIEQKFDLYPYTYDEIVKTHPSIFPDLNVLKAHVIDTPIALSLLRQIELCKDALKALLRNERPELFFDPSGIIDLLVKINSGNPSYYYTASPREVKFGTASQEIAQQADGLVVTSIVPHPSDPSKVILVAVKDEGGRSRIYHIITSKERLSLVPTPQPIIKTQYSNGVPFPSGIYQIAFAPYLKPEEVEGKIIVSPTSDPELVKFLDKGIIGIICDTGGVTTHLMNIVRDHNIPGLAATDVSLSQFNRYFSNLPIYIIGTDIYFLQYKYREGDLGYIAW